MSRGFTLLELLVALFVSALMFSMGYAALNQASANRERLRANQSALAQLQRAVQMFSQDAMQIMPRPVRDALGRDIEPALRLDPRQGDLLSLTRGGQSLALSEPRGRLLRVSYRLDGEQLVRLSSPVLDRTAASPPPVRRVLLDGVDSVQIRVLDASGEWLDTWPRQTPATSEPTARQQALRARPRALELRLQTRDHGEILRLFEVTG